MTEEPSSAELLDRMLPCDPKAEWGVIGSLILAPDKLSEVERILRAGDFYAAANQKPFAHMLAMRNGGGGAIDETLLVARLREHGDLEAIGGVEYLAEVMNSVEVAAHAEHYAKIVRDRATARDVVETAKDLLQEAYSGQVSGAELAARARSRFESAAEDSAKMVFPARSCAELIAAKFELRWLVENLIVDGQPLLLAGPKKSLKTSFLIDLALSLAMGGFFLGAFRVPEAARVGLMTGESGLATIQETIIRVATAMHVDPSQVTNLVIADTVPQFGHLEHMDALRAWILGNELVVLIIDPVYMAMDGGDASNLFIMGGLLRSISELCQELNVTLILAHHTRKGIANPYDPPELEDIAWAGFQEFARQWLLVGRREKYEPGTGEHRLWLSGGGSVGHSVLKGVDVSEGVRPGRFWNVKVMAADEVRSEAEDRQTDAREAKAAVRAEKQLEADKRRLCNALAKYSDGETPRVLRDTAGLSATRFNVAIAALLDDKAAGPCEVSKRNGKARYEGYKLVEGPPL